MLTVRRFLHAAALLLLALTAQGCGRSELGWWPLDPDPDAIRAHGELVVLTRYAPTVYYEDRDNRPAGFEHDLALALARELGVPARFVALDSIEAVLQGLHSRRGHVAAAGLTDTVLRAGRLERSAGYQEVNEEVVCRRGERSPRTLAELPGTALVVTRASSHAEHLAALKEQLPGLAWSESESSVETLLEQVSSGDIACTVADSLTLEVNRRYTPELEVALTLGEGQKLAWYFPRGATALRALADTALAGLRASGRLERLHERHFGFTGDFDYVDTLAFARAVAARLPSLQPLFEAAASETGLPWTLLAAVSYQESHWETQARSPTGVRGLMMLTRVTAAAHGVSDRLDPAQSVRAGSSYLAALLGRLPPTIEQPDRIWMALAAYNIGYGHVMDARRLARERGLDADSWTAVKRSLPMLAQPEHFRRARHGYARGRMPVHYVRRVRHFEDLLLWQFASRERRGL